MRKLIGVGWEVTGMGQGRIAALWCGLRKTLGRMAISRRINRTWRTSRKLKNPIKRALFDSYTGGGTRVGLGVRFVANLKLQGDADP